MAVEVPQNEKISGGEKNGWEKKSVLLSVEEEQMEGTYTLRNEMEEELFCQMLTPT